MAVRISLTPELLNSQAKEMKALMSEYDEFFLNVLNLLENTNNNLSENLSKNFKGKICSAQKSFSGIVSMLDFGAKAALNSADSLNSLDKLLYEHLSL